jgi:CDP-4-dehydro-6-deoxyglucose reductase/ferredoxin-NAD(P)+ reductase (naphthalene dioxygenase ferredoxin-specific)
MPHSVKVGIRGTPCCVRQGETVLEALIRNGIDYPHGCTSGVCGMCKSRLILGEVELAQYYPSVLTDEEREAGLTLVCCAEPLSDCTVSPVQTDALLPPVTSVPVKISRMERLTHDICRLSLAVDGGRPLHFLAGQYVSLSTETLPGREFSMANRPGSAELELFVRRVPGGAFTGFIFEQATVGQTLIATGPYGLAFLREGHIGPILAVAGGSGLAPVLSIVRTALAHGMTQPIRLFVGVRAERDVYLEHELLDLQARHQNLSAMFVLSDPGEDSERPFGLVHEVLATRLSGEELAETRAYVAGPPVMVEAVSRVLIERGLPPSACHADPFLTSADKVDRKRGAR